MLDKVNWQDALRPLIKKYKGKKHPLEYNSIYQLLIMVILSAQDSDKNINSLAPEFFKAFPNIKSLNKMTAEMLIPYISKVRGHRKRRTG